MLGPSPTTQTTPQGYGTQETGNEFSPRSSGTNQSPSSTTLTLTPSSSMPPPPNLQGRHWTYREVIPGYYAPNPRTEDPILLLLFDEVQYPSLPHHDTDSPAHPSTSGPMSSTPVTAPQSLNEDIVSNKGMGHLTLSSRNLFCAAAQRTHSTPTGSTMSGTSSNRSTETSSVLNESRPGSFNEQTSRLESAGSMQEGGRTWSTSLPSIGELPSISEPQLQGTSSPEYTQTETGSYTLPIQASIAETYNLAPRRSNDSFNAIFSDSPGGWEIDPIWMDPLTNPYEGFEYDWNSVAPGFQPSTNAEDFFEVPQPMSNSLPNP